LGGVSNDIVESVEPDRFVVAMDECPRWAQGLRCCDTHLSSSPANSTFPG